jgi:hypothetical protein
MDALTWFKSVFRRGLTTPAPLRADVASEMWPDVPLHLVAASLRPRPASSERGQNGDDDDGEDWDAVIAQAKVQAATRKAPMPPPLPRMGQASRKAPSTPPPRPRDIPPEMQETPPPLRAPQVPKLAIARPRGPRASPDLVAWGGGKKPFGARATREEDQATPPPLAKAPRVTGPLLRRVK